MTLEEARSRCEDLCRRFPNQEFDILGVVAQSKRTSKISLEASELVVFDAKRAKEASLEVQGTNVTPFR
jgi:hypothetical protein